MEMRRVKRLWQESEHRLLLLQSELRSAQVTQSAITADLTNADSLLAERAKRIDELERTAQLDQQGRRANIEQLERVRADAKAAQVEASELSLQMVASSATNLTLRAEVELLESSVAVAEEQSRTMLSKLHASASERATQHRRQLALWEQKAAALLDAGPTAKLDLILMQGNADLFDSFAKVLSEQRDNCDKEAALLKQWTNQNDARTREQLQAQLSLMRHQISDMAQARDLMSAKLREGEINEAISKVEEAERAIKQLESQLADERRNAASHERAAAAAAAEHRRNVGAAVEELRAAASEMGGGLSKVVALETETVVALQKHEAFRARTARLLLLQRHRPTLAKCYHAWRNLAAQSAGAKMAEGGAAHAIAELKTRSLSLALGSGVAGSLVSEYMRATLAALEDEWARKEGEAGAHEASLREELEAARALAAQAMRESDEARARLDRQAASLASEGEALRRSNALAREAERRAEKELAQTQLRLQKASSGVQVDGLRLGMENQALEKEVGELRAMLAAAEEGRRVEVAMLSAKLQELEMTRLQTQEHQHAQARKGRQVESAAEDRMAVAVAAAQMEAGRQVEAFERQRKEERRAIMEEKAALHAQPISSAASSA